MCTNKVIFLIITVIFKIIFKGIIIIIIMQTITIIKIKKYNNNNNNNNNEKKKKQNNINTCVQCMNHSNTLSSLLLRMLRPDNLLKRLFLRLLKLFIFLYFAVVTPLSPELWVSCKAIVFLAICKRALDICLDWQINKCAWNTGTKLAHSQTAEPKHWSCYT